MAKSACKLRANRIIDQERSETPREWTFTLPAPPSPPPPRDPTPLSWDNRGQSYNTERQKPNSSSLCSTLLALSHLLNKLFNNRKVFTPTSETLCSNNLNNPYNKLFGNVGNKKKKKCMEIVNTGICNFINI